MPIYEFKCPSCKVIEGRLDNEAPECVTCKVEMKRLYSFSTTKMPTGAGTKMGKR